MIGNKDKNFSLDNFEGPLDLLLHLIKNKKLDILAISLVKVADQFVEYINQTQNLNLDIASEYLLIASQLLEIKTRFILNSDIFIEKDEYQEDTKLLLEKLIEYEKFKKLSNSLGDSFSKNLVFEKETDDLMDFINDDNQNLIKIISNGSEDIGKTLRNILKKVSMSNPLEQTIKLKRISIEDRKKEIEQELEINNNLSFFSLLKNSQRYYIALTLLVILELVIKGKIIIQQNLDSTDVMITKI